MTVILDGKRASAELLEELKGRVEKLKERGVTPSLALVLVGMDEGSRRYVKMKARRCKRVGVEATVHHLPEASTEEVVSLIEKLSGDPSIHGVMVQLPLPEGVDESRVLAAIPPEKDVDGLTNETLGRLLRGERCYPPAGVGAILELLDRYGVEYVDRHWVIVGLSDIVGKPLAALLMNRGITATCVRADHPRLSEYTRMGEVLVVDIGRKWAVTAEMVRPGAVVIDNGNNYEDGKVYGDVDFEAVREVASAITPVPGGVGPMLIANLIKNTVEAAEASS
ncbi:bifunctional methylenetetrahydrofolate dehydrogenase/methenyltetrahydrofolate cyclohydrolase [Candidatus Bathyarchaeota archaeon]|nr:MAG: bifunctional methylenetetrahydrofolate dehydrogenase/methenyltetrahydrofolate cyclohydrolase [Candidatus Bathyarchaeota archaeon]